MRNDSTFIARTLTSPPCPRPHAGAFLFPSRSCHVTNIISFD